MMYSRLFKKTPPNPAQLSAITHVDGPLLIIAGPGTGKTKTLVDRITYMVVEKGIDPESVMVVTFTKKAAKELLLRIQNALREVGIQINVHEMYIGTIHDICVRILDQYRDKTNLDKNYRIAEDNFYSTIVYDSYIEEKYLDEGAISIKEPGDALNLTEMVNFGKAEVGITGRWNRSLKIASSVSKLKEELIDPSRLKESSDNDEKNYGIIMEKMDEIMKYYNSLDFSRMQTYVYELFCDYPEVLSDFREKIKYVMVDEYQDTNYIQEKIVFKIAGENKNICVVGDDDQSLYRFRGATVRNILRFEENPEFNGKEVKKVFLNTNHRSSEEIINLYSHWMKNSPEGYFEWGNDRFDKDLASFGDKVGKRGVAKISVTAGAMESRDDLQNRWAKEHVSFIKKLKDEGVITDYNQVAFLAYSIKSPDIVSIMKCLEKNDIPVYSPRSGLFFNRDEVKLFLGAFYSCFVKVYDIKKDDIFATTDLGQYLVGRVREYDSYNGEGAKELKEFVTKKQNELADLKENTNYGFTELAYMLLGQNAFQKYLGVDPGNGVVNERPARNLAALIGFISKYEEFYGVEVLSVKYIVYYVKRLFAIYFSHLFKGDVYEYEDESEYAPSGCVSFLTIHQSKGMEFPVVIVASLGRKPGNDMFTSSSDRKLDKIIRDYSGHEEGENRDNILFYDFWRLYYVAFSRAKNLLALSYKDNRKEPQYATAAPCFLKLVNDLKIPNYSDIDLSYIKPEEVTSTDLMKTYSFTSKIGVYETCPKQYKFFKEYGFPEIGNVAMLFGSLVHQTVEDIHRAAIEKRTEDINDEKIEEWLRDNYRTLSSASRGHLGETQIKSALKQVKKYVEFRNGKWDTIVETEVEVSHIDENCILLGDVDLVEGSDGKYELVDFKTQASSELRGNPEWMKKYQRQLSMYAHLIREKTGKVVERTHLYCTKEDGDNNPVISFLVDSREVNNTIDEFRQVVRKIESHDYSGGPKDKNTCKSCNMRFSCIGVLQNYRF